MAFHVAIGVVIIAIAAAYRKMACRRRTLLQTSEYSWTSLVRIGLGYPTPGSIIITLACYIPIIACHVTFVHSGFSYSRISLLPAYVGFDFILMCVAVEVLFR